MSDQPGFIQSAVLQVRYARGMGYLNRCGILVQKLQDILKEPFRILGMPTIEAAELRSDAERISVKFSRDSFTVTQFGPLTAARIEQLAPDGWVGVRDDLEVGRNVTRCGFRIITLWPTKDIETARDSLNGTKIVAPSEKWMELFGQPSYSTYVAINSNPNGSSERVSVDAIEQQVEGLLPVEYEGIYPSSAISLDLDYVYANEGRASYPLGPGQLRDFVRVGWEKAKLKRALFERVIRPEKET